MLDHIPDHGIVGQVVMGLRALHHAASKTEGE